MLVTNSRDARPRSPLYIQLEKRFNDVIKYEENGEHLRSGSANAAGYPAAAVSVSEEGTTLIDGTTGLSSNEHFTDTGFENLPHAEHARNEPTVGSRCIDDETQYAVAAIETLALSKEPVRRHYSTRIVWFQGADCCICFRGLVCRAWQSFHAAIQQSSTSGRGKSNLV